MIIICAYDEQIRGVKTNKKINTIFFRFFALMLSNPKLSAPVGSNRLNIHKMAKFYHSKINLMAVEVLASQYTITISLHNIMAIARTG